MAYRAPGAAAIDEPPFMASEPPPRLATGLAALLLVLFGGVLLVSVSVQVPETVSGRFTLVPVRGTDPVRAPRAGQVMRVSVRRGELVARGAPLLVIRSALVGDRSAELRTRRAQLASAPEAARNTTRAYEDRRRGDEQEGSRLRAQLASLDRVIALEEQQRELASERAERYRRGEKRGAASRDEFVTNELESERLAEEVARTIGERAQAAATLARLPYEISERESAYREALRRLGQERDEADIRADLLSRELDGVRNGEQTITASCAGVVVALRVATAGAVVTEGELLGEVACTSEPLQAEIVVPAVGVARVRPGHTVRLLLDAYPYLRFGAQRGRVRWVSPAGQRSDSANAAGDGFRALIALDDSVMRIGSRAELLLPGMGGMARVIVDRRTLASYIFFPLRNLYR